MAILTRIGIVAAAAMLISAAANAQTPAPQVVKLWPNGAPGSQAHRGEPERAQDWWVKNIHNPSVTAFPADPSHNSGVAIVVLPGGGHNEIVWTTEGVNVARALHRMGISAFVVKYRLAREPGSTYSIERDETADVRRAMQLVRAHAGDYGVDPHRIGVMGFSAGGELVGMLADYGMTGSPAGGDALDRVSPRPDFQVLVFPGPGAVRGPVPKDAPPAFLVAGSKDECCGPPTVALYELLQKAGVPAELHMYAETGHAFNLDESNRISILHWPDRLYDWLADSGFLDGRQATR
ncbi:MAG TPA: alpha/beta hydrolase [Sphingomicrobium sp.]|nr:alpha/beta hydrolase [Sphingomicrobium sp.]